MPSRTTDGAADGPGGGVPATAELAALAATLAETTARIGRIAEAASDDENSPVRELFEIERDLLGAGRRLDALLSRLARS